MCDADEALARLLQEQEDCEARAVTDYEADLALARQLQRQEEEEEEEEEAVARAQQKQLDRPPMSNQSNTKATPFIIISDDSDGDDKISDGDADLALAWQLHQEEKRDHMNERDCDTALAWRLLREESLTTQKKQSQSRAAVQGEISLEDLINDPTPDIHALFVAFDNMYFNGKLAAVELQWSKRMKLCAGLCYYKGPGSCLIRLSEPLLKYRPREDMINTLLHEMIHAFLFLLHGPVFADHDGHGPEFLKEAARLNDRAGTNITTYHNFHDEVDHYRQHVWQCDGVCREKPPFFGVVKRSMNRAPQPADTWWQEHQLTCGGRFHKVSEPENIKKKKSRKITEFFDQGESSSSNSGKRRKTGA